MPLPYPGKEGPTITPITDKERKANIPDAEYLARIKKQFPDPEEAARILAYDRAVEKDSTELLDYDLSPEKKKVAQGFARTGTRKTPVGYKFPKKERKANPTKGGIIAELAAFLEHNSEFAIENLQVTNKERQIAFEIAGTKFELVLTQKRAPKK